MNRHITYCDHNMTISAKRCSETALSFGCHTSTIYRLHDLNKDFLKRNAETLACDRGAGYWCWKPQIILQEFEQCKENDLVIYTDAGVEFINSVHYFEDYLRDDFCMLFGSLNKHADYCKGDVLILAPKGDHNQLQATAMIFKATTKAVNFLNLWSQMCQNKQMIDDSPSHAPNADTFIEHRHDQAILTSLQLLYEIPSHWWPALYKHSGGQFVYSKAGHESDVYRVPIFYHHRKRNDEW